MTDKVHGYGAQGEKLTGSLDFFVLRTTLDIRPNGVVAPVEDVVLPYTDVNGNVYSTSSAYNAARAIQQRFDFLVQTISIKAQPVILGSVPAPVNETAPIADLPVTGGLATGTAVPVFTLRFSIEHTNALGADELEDMLNGFNGFVKSVTPNTTNVSVTLAGVLHSQNT